MTHQSYFMDCLCLSALLIKYLLLRNALPVHPCWLIIIPSPLALKPFLQIKCSKLLLLIQTNLPQQPQLVEGNIVPLWWQPSGPAQVHWVWYQPQGSHSCFCLEKTLCLYQCSTCKLSESCWNWKRTKLLLVWMEHWHLIKKKNQTTNPKPKQRTAHLASLCGRRSNATKVHVD